MLSIYRNKTILVTGHTGFKGSWLCIWLSLLGARVIGFSLPAWKNERLFRSAALSGRLVDERGDVADLGRVREVFSRYRPRIVFHLAAQPLVRDSYRDPIATFRTNVTGTANVLECIRRSPAAISGVMITTDKCYKNKERRSGYRETDELGGHDPYSMSKAAAELVIDSYRRSFFAGTGRLVASARAGNNLGGGDYSADRLIPDCIRALEAGRPIAVRNPASTRPWQHVLEPLYGYLLLGARLMHGEEDFAEAWNFGPERSAIVPVSRVADLVIKSWGSGRWIDVHRPGDLHEAKLLSLVIAKAKRRLGWKPKWDMRKAVRMTVEWYKNVGRIGAYSLCERQIDEYMYEK